MQSLSAQLIVNKIQNISIPTERMYECFIFHFKTTTKEKLNINKCKQNNLRKINKRLQSYCKQPTDWSIPSDVLFVVQSLPDCFTFAAFHIQYLHHDDNDDDDHDVWRWWCQWRSSYQYQLHHHDHQHHDWATRRKQKMRYEQKRKIRAKMRCFVFICFFFFFFNIICNKAILWTTATTLWTTNDRQWRRRQQQHYLGNKNGQ